MINNKITYVLAVAALLIACGKKEKSETYYTSTEKTEIIDLENKGIGPVQSIILDAEVNQKLAKDGEKLFNSKCAVCHETSRDFIGPNPSGILERRSPEWVMNMILNPSEMIKKDPIAKQLLIDYDGSPMVGQGLTELEARDILEYFRTLK